MAALHHNRLVFRSPKPPRSPNSPIHWPRVQTGSGRWPHVRKLWAVSSPRQWHTDRFRARMAARPSGGSTPHPALSPSLEFGGHCVLCPAQSLLAVEIALSIIRPLMFTVLKHVLMSSLRLTRDVGVSDHSLRRRWRPPAPGTNLGDGCPDRVVQELNTGELHGRHQPFRSFGRG